MSVTLLAYALFAIWAGVALVAFVMTDLSARCQAHVARARYAAPRVIARADGTRIPAATYRRASV